MKVKGPSFRLMKQSSVHLRVEAVILFTQKREKHDIGKLVQLFMSTKCLDQ